jgi:hypothetical protein
MATKTNYEADEATSKVMNIIKENGGKLSNIDDNLSYQVDRFGNYTITADSNTGSIHTTRSTITIKPNPSSPGAIIDFKPGQGCNSSEAQELEDKVMREFFGGRV